MSSQSSDSVLRVILVVLAALVLLPFLMMAFAVPMMGGYYGMHDGGGWFAGLGLVWLVVLLGGGYVLYRALTGGESSDGALEELRHAYARGEMDHDEYEERKERLERD
jgi:putative membrane protein